MGNKPLKYEQKLNFYEKNPQFITHLCILKMFTWMKHLQVYTEFSKNLFSYHTSLLSISTVTR